MQVITTKVSKTIGLFRKLQKTLPRPVLITMSKAFVRPHLDYGGINYDEAYNKTFHQKSESIQYNACLALSGDIRGSSTEKLYHELSLKSLQRWHISIPPTWYRKPFLFRALARNRKTYAFCMNREKRNWGSGGHCEPLNGFIDGPKDKALYNVYNI